MIVHRTALLSCIALAASLFVSCGHDDDVAPAEPLPSVERYSLLTPGNYWIYEQAHLDMNAMASVPSPDLDSVFVAGDSTINGNTYAVLRHATSGYTVTQIEALQRDSADRIVNEHGEVLFQVTDQDQVIMHQTNTLFSWEIYWVSYVGPTAVTVPLNTFSTREVRIAITATGTLAAPNQPTRYYRALDHGLVMSQVFYASGWGNQRRLVRDHIQ